MTIAKEKKASNIAEYILYMWQIEDLIRAYNFDMANIEANIINQFEVDTPTKTEIKKWYVALIKMMHEEKIMKSGHLIFVKNTLNELYHLHKTLLLTPEHVDYMRAYSQFKIIAEELAAKVTDAENEIDLCFTALYGSLMLKLQKKELSEDTTEAINKISQLIALLAKKYHQIDRGEIDLSY